MNGNVLRDAPVDKFVSSFVLNGETISLKDNIARGDISELDSRLTDAEGTVDSLTELVGDGYDSLDSKINNAFDVLDVRIDDLESEDASIRTSMSGLNNYLNILSSRFDGQETVNQLLDERIRNNEVSIATLDDEQNVQDLFISHLTENCQDNADEIVILKQRMDTFSSLTDASTSGDAELTDIRVGVNGITYPNAGDAVRDQFKLIKGALIGGIPFSRNSNTKNGVTYTWDGTKYTFNGTATGNFAESLVSKRLIYPACAGKKLLLHYHTTNSDVRFSIIWFDSNDTPTYLYISDNGYTMIDVPVNAVSWSIRLYVQNGSSFSNDILDISELYIITEDFYYLDKVVSKNLINNQMYNVLNNIGFIDDVTKKGVTFHQNEDGSYRISGTATDTGVLQYDIVYNKTSLLNGIKGGKYYTVIGHTGNYNLRVITYTGESDNGTALLQKGGDFRERFQVPSNATGITFRLQNPTGYSVNENVYENDLLVYVIEDNTVNEYILGGTIANSNSKIWSLGNSFMHGAVHTNGHLDHLCSYNDAIYGVVANSLNIPSFNNVAEMHSSTGLLSAGTDGTFMEIITNTSLVPYDYLFTQFNGSDINYHALGTVNSPVGENSIAGAIGTLVNYIKNSNGLCKLIIMSVPPYSSDPATSGNNVFTGNWGMGYSINDLDDLMYKLAKKYHFIYISWQDLEISYHYMDYADFPAGATGPRHANSDKVYRALGLYVANQISAVSSPIANSKL